MATSTSRKLGAKGNEAYWNAAGDALVGAGGKVAPYVGIADRHRMLGDQPYGITRPVRSPGKLVARFVNSEITVNNGAPAHADHTGFDASGNITGIVSITGQPNLLKLTPAADTLEGIRFTNFATSVVTPQLVDGKIGFWVYIENLPRFAPTETPTTTLLAIMTTEAAGSTTNGLQVTWTANQLHEGWNFLTFVMRNPLAYQTGGGATEYHPWGVAPVKYGTGVDGDIVNKALTKLVLQWTNASGATIYLDSIWTGWDTEPQVILGADALETDVTDYVLPLFEQYGWVGYVAVPARVYASGSTILADLTAADGYTDMVARADALKAAGWDFINHTLNHRSLGTLTSAAEIAYEILGVQPIYAATGCTKGNEFYASPNSSTSRLAEKVVAGCGMQVQRHAVKQNVAITPWGIPNTNHIGASGAGSAASGGYCSITDGAVTNVIGLQINSKLRILTDIMIAYGATWFPFWHYVTTTGDSGSGEDLTGDPLYMTLSAFTKWMEYIREKELAGEIRVCKGVTGFYYGIG